MPAREADDIQSLRVGIEALQLLNTRGSLSTGELANELGLSRARAYRVLKTLLAQGYVAAEERRHGTRYRLSIRVRGLSDGFDGDVRMIAAAQPLMLEYTAKDGWPLALTTPAGDRCFVRLTTDHATSRVIKRYRAGFYAPTLYSAGGLVCLASQPSTIQVSVVKSVQHVKLPPYAREITTEGYMALLQQIARLDYATYEPVGERENSIAVPLRHGGVVLAALTLRYMRVSAGAYSGVDQRLELLREIARRIETQMNDNHAPVELSGPADRI